MLFGLLNINKPTGITSREVVDAVVRLAKPAKVGHAGTLDPLATGVLVVCVGPATRLVSQVQSQRKVYRAKFLIGRRSDTDDITGRVVEVAGADAVTRHQIEDMLPQFVGQVEQVPPQFSAIRVEGRRAYKLARQGQSVDLPAKTVEIERITLIEFKGTELELDIECGSGTYIRSIGRDLGELLGCGAVMSELSRTRVGPFSLDAAVSPDEIDQESLPRHLLSPTAAVEHLTKLSGDDQTIAAIAHGRLVACRALKPPAETHSLSDGQTVAILTAEGELACLAHYRKHDDTVAPKQVFVGLD